MGVNKVELFGDTLMDITDTTATEDEVLEGATFYAADGEKKSGAVKITTKLADLEDDETHRLVTDVEKARWDKDRKGTDITLGQTATGNYSDFSEEITSGSTLFMAINKLLSNTKKLFNIKADKTEIPQKEYLTMKQYEDLPSSKETDGIQRIITDSDSDSGIALRAIRWDDTHSKTGKSNPQDAVDKAFDEIAELNGKKVEHVTDTFTSENGLVVLRTRFIENEIISAVGKDVLCIPFRYSGNGQWYIKTLEWNQSTPTNKNGTFEITINYR